MTFVSFMTAAFVTTSWILTKRRTISRLHVAAILSAGIVLFFTAA